MSENPIRLALKEWEYVGSQNQNSRDSRLDPWAHPVSHGSSCCLCFLGCLPHGFRMAAGCPWSWLGMGKSGFPCLTLPAWVTCPPLTQFWGQEDRAGAWASLPLHGGVTLCGTDGCPVKLGLWLRNEGRSVGWLKTQKIKCLCLREINNKAVSLYLAEYRHNWNLSMKMITSYTAIS